jgi:UDP-GlcNAc:undecaprenyl-phosphate GlcNAc-1-phosphate transferase
MTLLAFLKHAAFGAVLTLLSAALTWVLIHRGGFVDHPNERSSHTRPTPRSGGLAVVAAFFVGMAGLYALADTVELVRPYFLGFFVSCAVLAIVSVWDDLKGLGFRGKLLTQVACAGVVVSFGIVLDRVPVPFDGIWQLGLFGYGVTVVWLVAMTNAFNFMDGLDGLAGGTAALAAALFGVVTLMEGSHFVYLASWVMVGGCLGFLIFNFPPARIFMGDVGSQFLGFAFAALAIIAMRYDHSHTSFLVMPLLFLHFLWDTGFTIVRRWLAGDNIAQAHRTHLYQLFNRLGFSHREVTLYHYLVTLAQGLGAVVMVQIPGETRLLVFVPFLLWQAGYTAVIVRGAVGDGLIPRPGWRRPKKHPVAAPVALHKTEGPSRPA